MFKRQSKSLSDIRKLNLTIFCFFFLFIFIFNVGHTHHKRQFPVASSMYCTQRVVSFTSNFNLFSPQLINQSALIQRPDWFRYTTTHHLSLRRSGAGDASGVVRWCDRTPGPDSFRIDGHHVKVNRSSTEKRTLEGPVTEADVAALRECLGNCHGPSFTGSCQ